MLENVGAVFHFTLLKKSSGGKYIPVSSIEIAFNKSYSPSGCLFNAML